MLLGQQPPARKCFMQVGIVPKDIRNMVMPRIILNMMEVIIMSIIQRVPAPRFVIIYIVMGTNQIHKQMMVWHVWNNLICSNLVLLESIILEMLTILCP